MSILSFNATPPEMAYGDASFFIGVLFKEDKYHGEYLQLQNFKFRGDNPCLRNTAKSLKD